MVVIPQPIEMEQGFFNIHFNKAMTPKVIKTIPKYSFTKKKLHHNRLQWNSSFS